MTYTDGVTDLRASFGIAACFALLACGGTEAGDAADASADTNPFDGFAPVCPVDICTDDPSKPPTYCCQESCIGAPCDPSEAPCMLPCIAGMRGHLYCADGTWQSGHGLFPCGGFDAGPEDAADAPTCSLGDAVVADASCSAADGGAGCGAGEICAVEVGGPRRRGATWCVTIPPECGGTATCACMGVCACGTWRCVDGPTGEIYCDDGTI
jgi:hypothetical protein